MTDKEESENEKIKFDLDSNNPEKKIDWFNEKYPKQENTQEEIKFNRTDSIKKFITDTLLAEK